MLTDILYVSIYIYVYANIHSIYINIYVYAYIRTFFPIYMYTQRYIVTPIAPSDSPPPCIYAFAAFTAKSRPLSGI